MPPVFGNILLRQPPGFGNINGESARYFDDTYLHNGTPQKCSGYCADVWFDSAMRFIEDNRDRPFFAYLATNAPHSPYHVPEQYSRLYRDRDVPNAGFYGMIANLDENVGRLLARLKSLALEDNTIVIFMTDNGTAAGFQRGKGFNVGMRGTKGSEYDGGHRVPCFIRWPAGGLDGGRDVSRLTSHIDLLPTLIELCGLPGPTGVTFDGASIGPLLKAKETGWPDRVVVTDSQRVEHPQKWRQSAVMTDRWRLVNGRELYDISADPGQKNDVSREHSEVVRELRDAYETWWLDVSARFDAYCDIVIGSDKENPSRLTSHDWHEANPSPWNQTHVLHGVEANGFWTVEAEQAGEYEFSLRRWPREVGAPINAAIPGGRAIQATKARLVIGPIDLEKAILEDAKEAAFRVELQPGRMKLQTWLIAEGGVSRGAYYVCVNRVT
ncbi:MAG TPA: sulfatase-like hydrolase/transferase [Sedimentisphaerales bacterium]|nr:sulfatase-like hydrolase/transferase [Sedimentisphaerales bacterium]